MNKNLDNYTDSRRFIQFGIATHKTQRMVEHIIHFIYNFYMCESMWCMGLHSHPFPGPDVGGDSNCTPTTGTRAQ